MPNFLGLDVGRTTITAVVVDVSTGEVVASHSAPNDCEVTPRDERELATAPRLVAAVNAGAFRNLTESGRIIRYEEES